jgi:ATP-dependent RNA helicase SUPV3L1/SUV3
VAALDGPSRKRLAQMGVRMGVLHLFCPALFKPQAIRRRALLWRIHRDKDAVPDLPKGVLSGKSIVTLPPGHDFPGDVARVLGFIQLGPRALRLYQVERLAAEVRKLARQGPFAATAALIHLAGAEGDDLTHLLAGLGYRLKPDADGALFVPRKPAHQNHGQRRRHKRKAAKPEDAKHNEAGLAAAKAGGPPKPSHGPKPHRPHPQDRPRPAFRPSDSPFAKLGEMLQARRRGST